MRHNSVTGAELETVSFFLLEHLYSTATIEITHYININTRMISLSVICFIMKNIYLLFPGDRRYRGTYFSD